MSNAIIGFGVYQILKRGDRTGGRGRTLRRLSAHRITAAGYGNEEPVGQAVTKVASRATTCSSRRSSGSNLLAMKPRRTQAFEQSLVALGWTYVDLYLIHQPLGDYYSESRAMEASIRTVAPERSESATSIRTDWSICRAQRSHRGREPDPDQSVLSTTADHDVMTQLGVQLESWGPFAEGRNNLFSDPVLTESVRPRQVRGSGCFALDDSARRRGDPEVGSSREDRQNFDVFDFELAADEMERIAALDKGVTQFFDHRDAEMVNWLNGRWDK